MTIQQITLQLDRIEEIQSELRRCVMDDSLPGLEPLIDEMGTRLRLLLNGREPLELLLPHRTRLELVVRNNERLEELMQVQLKLVANRLQKTHATKQVFELYAGETYRLKQLTRHALDLDG
jgi:hypothetical protein